jgi:hypothetical protein
MFLSCRVSQEAAVKRYVFVVQCAVSPPPTLRDVALQVAFERQILKPVFHLIGER